MTEQSITPDGQSVPVSEWATADRLALIGAAVEAAAGFLAKRGDKAQHADREDTASDTLCAIAERYASPAELARLFDGADTGRPSRALIGVAAAGLRANLRRANRVRRDLESRPGRSDETGAVNLADLTPAERATFAARVSAGGADHLHPVTEPLYGPVTDTYGPDGRLTYRAPRCAPAAVGTAETAPYSADRADAVIAAWQRMGRPAPAPTAFIRARESGHAIGRWTVGHAHDAYRALIGDTWAAVIRGAVIRSAPDRETAALVRAALDTAAVRPRGSLSAHGPWRERTGTAPGSLRVNMADVAERVYGDRSAANRSRAKRMLREWAERTRAAAVARMAERMAPTVLAPWPIYCPDGLPGRTAPDGGAWCADLDGPVTFTLAPSPWVNGRAGTGTTYGPSRGYDGPHAPATARVPGLRSNRADNVRQATGRDASACPLRGGLIALPVHAAEHAARRALISGPDWQEGERGAWWSVYGAHGQIRPASAAVPGRW